MPGKSTHLHVIPQQSTQKQQTCSYGHDKKQQTFFTDTARAPTSSRNNFGNLRFFAKVSFPVGSIIPCTHVLSKWSYRNSTLIEEHNFALCMYLRANRFDSRSSHNFSIMLVEHIFQLKQLMCFWWLTGINTEHLVLLFVYLKLNAKTDPCETPN